MENNRQEPEPGYRLVVVLETNDQIQLALAKGLLADAEIPLFIQGQLATLYQPVDPFLHKWVRLQVPEDRAAEAQEILEPVLKPRPYLC
jgi:Putative prokaryotic signal transducing protein